MPELGDLKAALGNSSKPDITHVRTPLMNYVARACEYGNDKYERANYMRKKESRRLDFERLRAYTRAAVSHLTKMLDSMELHQSTDPNLEDWEGMKAACFAPDTDETPGAKVGASGLPHLSHACASINMGVTQAVHADLLPVDPGTPWKEVTQPRTLRDIIEFPGTEFDGIKYFQLNDGVEVEEGDVLYDPSDPDPVTRGPFLVWTGTTNKGWYYRPIRCKPTEPVESTEFPGYYEVTEGLIEEGDMFANGGETALSRSLMFGREIGTGGTFKLYYRPMPDPRCEDCIKANRPCPRDKK
jgi:hypothetical protein